MQSAVSLGQVQPNNCALGRSGTYSSGGIVRWRPCNGYIGVMTYGPGTTGNRKLTTQPSVTNPGGVPVPPGETPVLFVQFVEVSLNSPVTFTAPTVPPLSNRSRITGVPPGTYKFYAYNGAALIGGFPINLGSPTAGGVLRFTSPPYSPLPQLGTISPGQTISFELVTP